MSQWIQVDILTTTEGIEPVAAVILDLGLGYAVQDSADFQLFLDGKQGHWDYIDDEVMKLQDAPSVVTVYLADKAQGLDYLATITKELERLRTCDLTSEWGELSYSLKGVEEEDWSSAWKQYFHPIKVTKRITVAPSWEDYTPKDGETVIYIDPGMAFGTGTHESTQLCLEFLDNIIQGGEKVLDVGCGSGILSLAAVKMGADTALGIDIDQVAVETAQENAKFNNLQQSIEFIQGNFVDRVNGKYNIVFANIVADAIIYISKDVLGFLEEDGYYITSGIIDDRGEEVKKALIYSGFRIVGKLEKNGWVSFCATKP